MPFYRYGNPDCPKSRNQTGHGFYSMVRAYFRDPDSRQFKPVGWYCEECKHVYTDPELEQLKKDQER